MAEPLCILFPTSEMLPASSIAEEISKRFPELQFEINEDDTNLDWVIDVPVQEGLNFRCQLNCQGDELHLQVESFWLEWFPAEKYTIQNYYLDAVCGLLSGEYRIMEYVRRGRGIGGELQVPEGDSWETIGNSFAAFLPRRWLSETRIIQNT